MRKSYKITLSDGTVHEVNGVIKEISSGDNLTLIDDKDLPILDIDPSQIRSMERLGKIPTVSPSGKKRAVKLSPGEVKQLLLLRGKMCSNSLAEKFGISKSYVKKIFSKYPKNEPAKSCTLH